MKTLGAVFLVLLMSSCATVRSSDEPAPFTKQNEADYAEWKAAAKIANEQLAKADRNEKMSESDLMDSLKTMAQAEKKIESFCTPERCNEYYHDKMEVHLRLKKLTDGAEEDQRKNSEDGIYNDACIAANQIVKAQSIIVHEKEIGKESGTVNMSTLHDAGGYLVQYKGELAQLITKYKAKTGKSIDLKSCDQ